MKKILLSIIAVVVVIGAAIVLFMLGSTDEKSQTLQPIENPVFVYVNIDQLATKGAFDKYITPENRSLIATVLSSQLDDVVEAEHLKNIITNISTIGIDTHKPIYGYLNDNLTDYIMMASLSDVAQMDRSVALLSYLLQQDGKDKIVVTLKDDVRSFEYDEIAVAYNASTLAIALSEGDDALSVAVDALARPEMDMSVFGASDMAVLVNTDRCIALANTKIEEAMAELTNDYNAKELDDEMYTAQVETLTETAELINSYASHFAPNSNVLLSATFDLGRMVLAYNSQGVNFGEYGAICKQTNPAHLSNLDKDSFAVMSAGVDGKLLAQFIRTMLSDDMFYSIGITPSNEINMIVSVACDALSTIDGGVTIALEEVEGEIKSRYNYYWDEYTVEPSIDSVKAMLMADVTDTYIISNIAQFAGGFLNKVDATHYKLSLMGYNFSMGQDDGLFHLGVNASPKTQMPSALDAAWAKDVEGTLGYMVVNVDALMDSKFMQSTNRYIEKQLLEEYRELYRNAAEMVSYIYASADSLESAEVVVVFDNAEVNALEQINALVLPTLMKECVKSLY